MKKQIIKLTTILAIGAVNGAVAIAALSGLFRLENAPMLSFSFIAGPGSIITATLMEGEVKERIIAALAAGLIATLIIMLAAGFGPKLLELINIKIIKIAGAISIAVISLMIAGIKIPDNTPLIIMIIGIIVGTIWR